MSEAKKGELAIRDKAILHQQRRLKQAPSSHTRTRLTSCPGRAEETRHNQGLARGPLTLSSSITPCCRVRGAGNRKRAMEDAGFDWGCAQEGMPSLCRGGNTPSAAPTAQY
ncbi:hypothetical protein F7725_021737 [Dissostichus mawsoni]|uniref:Uncharacterized protein n=1 Tax=Dissostichus mawsoni TaxID=36200 RepID=A0A7J5ZG61_DISMA|nr:hypothetical protein F7725_021737 [Dissostichus mawsoni]